MLRFYKTAYLLLLFKSLLFERLSNSLWESDVLLFPEIINIVSIQFYNFIEFIILFYTFLVIYIAEYKEYSICLISVLPVFTFENAIDNLRSIRLEVNVLSPLPSCCLLNSMILSTTLTILFGFSPSGVFF